MLAAHWEGNPNVIYCKARGSGGADEMAGVLQDSEVMYGLGKLLTRWSDKCVVLVLLIPQYMYEFMDWRK